MMDSASPKLYDLTHPFNSSTPAFPAFPRYSAEPLASVSKDGFEIHKLTFCSHLGTHIDAPSHFIQNGLTIDQIPLSTLIGPAVIIDLSENIQPKQKISWHDIKSYEPALKPGVVAVICTGWYEKWGTEEYFNHPYMMKEVAAEFVNRGVKVVAVDFLGPDETVLNGKSAHGFVFHEVALGSGLIIAENLTNLKALVSLSNVYVSLLPLKLEGVDGSPIRAIAWQIN